MKKRKIEIGLTIIISLIIWILIYMNSIPLNRNETIVIVGVVFIIVFSVSFLIRKFRKQKNTDEA